MSDPTYDGYHGGFANHPDDERLIVEGFNMGVEAAAKLYESWARKGFRDNDLTMPSNEEYARRIRALTYGEPTT